MHAALAHVCVETTDLKKTESFYRLLGLRRRFEFRNRKGLLVGFYLAFNNTTFIEVILVRKSQAAGQIRHFAIEVDDVDQAHRRLTEAGVEATKKTLASDRQWMITCHDPNGIYIEIQ